MVRGDAVSLTVIWKICTELGTDIGDLISIEKPARKINSLLISTLKGLLECHDDRLLFMKRKLCEENRCAI